jgi:hypothetical protein
MTRSQAEGVLKERRGSAYDPWIVDQFLRILVRLEGADAVAQSETSAAALDQELSPLQFEAISTTTAEEREFAELRRELARTTSVEAVTEVMFKHLRRLVPVATVALYQPKAGTNDLCVVACFGMGASVILESRVAVGDRISGWAFAHSQAVINSDATLELGPVARTFSLPLRYAAALPIIDGSVAALLMCYANEPFQKDHRRLLENAATLFVTSIQPGAASTPSPSSTSIGQPETQLIH